DEIRDQLELKKRECADLNEELRNCEYRIDKIESENEALTLEVKCLKERHEKTKLVLPIIERGEPRIVGKYESKGARNGRDVYRGPQGGLFLYNPGNTKYSIVGQDRLNIIFN
ncbi:unnamed protein product, partial [Brachionus calyciflorus]